MKKPKKYKSVDEMVKDISSPKFNKRFKLIQARCAKRMKLRQAVIDAAKDWVSGRGGLMNQSIALSMSVKALEKWEKKFETK